MSIEDAGGDRGQVLRHDVRASHELAAQVPLSSPPSFSASILNPFQRAITTLASPPRAPFDLEASDGPEDRLPIATTLAMLERWVERTQFADLGLYAGVEVTLSTFGVFGYVVHAAPTLREGVTAARRYGRLVSDKFAPAWAGCDRRLLLQLHHAGGGHTRTFADFLVSACFKLMLGSRAAAVKQVWFAHAKPAECTAYLVCFPGVALRFGAPCYGFVIAAEALDAPLPDRHAALYAMLCLHADAACARLDPRNCIVSRVRELLCEVTLQSEASAQRIAAALGISRRTLYRRLQAKGTTFRSERAFVRHHFAHEYLARAGLELPEIARILGFAQVQGFNRAFREWTGKTPHQYRAAVLPARERGSKLRDRSRA